MTTADLANRVEAGGNDLRRDSRVDELACNLADHGRELVGRGEVVHRLGETDEDGGDLELVVREVLDDVRVEGEDGELVRSAHASKEGHDEDLVVESVGAIVFAQRRVQLLPKRLGVVEELQRRKVDRGLLGCDLLLAPLDVRRLDVLLGLALGRLFLLVDLDTMLDRLDIGTLLRLVVRVLVVRLARVRRDEEEVDRSGLDLGVRVEARRGDDAHRLGVAPHVLSPELRRDLDRPHGLARADNLDVAPTRRLDASAKSLRLGVDATLNHAKQQTLHHAVKLVVLGLDVGIFDVAEDGLEDERAQVGRRSH